MTHPDKPWNARLKQEGPQAITREWNRPVVAALTAVTVVLALAGLFADLKLESDGLAGVCYAAAVLSGIIELVFLFDKRLWIARPRG